MLLQSFNHTEIFEMDYYFCPTAREQGEDEEADDGDADDDLCEKKSCKGFYLTDPGKERGNCRCHS